MARISGWEKRSLARSADVVEGDGVDAGDDLVDREQLVGDELALAEAGHAGVGVLEAEDQAAAEAALAALELLVGQAVGADLGELGTYHGEDVVELGRQAADRDPDQAGVGVVGGEGEDRVR